MKTKLARKIVAGAESGIQYPLHVLRKASLQVGRPIFLLFPEKGVNYPPKLVYYPKGLKGDFLIGRTWRPYVETIVANSQSIRNGYDSHPSGEFEKLSDIGITYPLSGGMNFNGVAYIATNIAKRLGAKVKFKFNSTLITARPINSPNDLKSWYFDKLEEAHQEYLQSDEYKEELRQQAAQQVIVDQLIAELPSILELPFPDQEEPVLDFIDRLSIHGDRNYLNFDKNAIAEQLETVGWLENAYTVDEEEYPELYKENKAILATNKSAFAQYIVGQGINFLKMGYAPHQVTHKFIRDYRNWGRTLEPVAAYGENDDEEYDDSDLE